MKAETNKQDGITRKTNLYTKDEKKMSDERVKRHGKKEVLELRK
ncbi:hypothetical protein [Niallia oryzisoli]